MVLATEAVALNLIGCACHGTVVPRTPLPAGLVFQVTPVSVHKSVATKSAVCGAVAPTVTGMRRSVAPAGAPARLLVLNFRYDSRLLSLVVDESFFTARSASVPKFVLALAPLRTSESAVGESAVYERMTSCGRNEALAFSLEANVIWL